MLLMQGDWWQRVRHFKPQEWGQWASVEAELVFSVDELRERAGVPCKIHIAFASSGHSTGSAHYRGMAVDLHLVGMSVVDQYLLAERMGCWGGIGLYPHWQNPGLHLDISTKGRRWIRDAAGVYLPLTWDNLKRECK